MAKKVYAMRGYLEYSAVIPAGKSKVVVDFSGGSISGNGVIPATFSTSNPFFQRVIENSDYFKTNRICLLRTFEDPKEDVPVQASSAETSSESNVAADLQAIAVDSLADAKQYLVDNFGERPSDLRSRAAIDKCAAAHGVVFTL